MTVTADKGVTLDGSLTSEDSTNTITSADGSFTVTDEAVISGENTSIEVSGDATFGSTLDTEDATVTITADGQMTVAGDTTLTGSTVTVTADKGVTLDGSLTSDGSITEIVSADGGFSVKQEADVIESDVTIDVKADATFGSTLDAGDSEISVTAGGQMTVADDAAFVNGGLDADADQGFIFNGKLTTEDNTNNIHSAQGGMTVEKETVISGESTDIEVGGDVNFKSTTDIQGADVNVTAGGSVDFHDEITSAESHVTLDAQGALDMANANLQNGSWVAEADGNVTFAIIEASENTVSLNSHAGCIDTTVADGYIRFTDEDESSDDKLILSAGDAVMDGSSDKGHIGREDANIIIDTADTLFIPAANDYYVDFVVLEGEELYQGKRPVTAIGSGYDENGDYQTGEKLTDAPDDVIYGRMEDLLLEDFAQIVIDRASDADQKSLLTESVLTGLIRDGSMDIDDIGWALPWKTKSELRALLRQGDTVNPGESLSGYQQLAQQIKAAFGQNYTTDADYDRWLMNAVTSGYVDADQMNDLLTGLVNDAEIQQMVQNAWEQADYEAHKATIPDEPVRREAVIEVGEAVGGAWVDNIGSITITQQEGTLTASAVLSQEGDVTLTAVNGGIEGDASEEINVLGEEITLTAAKGVGAETTLVIEQREMRPTLVANMVKPADRSDVALKPLGADGTPTGSAEQAEKPVETWALETLIDFEWLNVHYAEQATKLDVTAGGDVNIDEKNGDLGLGVIDVTNGDLTLDVPGTIYDKRDDSQTEPNISVEKGPDSNADATISAEGGTIGESDDYIDVDVDGTIYADAKGDVSLNDSGTLDLVLDSQEGQLNADAVGDANITDTGSDLIVGTITAGGDADVTAQGSITTGDPLGRPADIIAGSITITAEGDVAEADDHLTVDTRAEDGGVLTVTGDNVYVKEITGDTNLGGLTAGGDAELTTPGAIYDASGSGLEEKAEQAQKDAADADAKADQAEAEAYVQQGEADMAQEALDEAVGQTGNAYNQTVEGITELLEQARKDLEALTPDTQEHDDQSWIIKQLEWELEKAEGEPELREEAYEQAVRDQQAAQEALEKAQDEADAAREKAEQLRAEADAAQNAADAAADAARADTPTVNVEGDLTLNAESVGEKDQGLTMDVEGMIDVNANTEVNLSGQGNLELEGMEVSGDITITTIDGTINGHGVMEGSSIDVSSENGDVGKKDNYLIVDVDRVDARGDNVYIRNLGDTEVGDITADNEIVLESGGKVTVDEDEVPNFHGSDLTINAGGDIGSQDKPIITDTEAFHGHTPGDMFIDNQSRDLTMTDVRADDLVVRTDGNITGSNIRVEDIHICADGNVGTAEVPMYFYADGKVHICAGLSICNWVNLYRPGVYEAMFVFHMEVSVGDETMTMYVIMGVDAKDHLTVLGLFLCEGEADAQYWQEVFTALRKADLVTTGMVYHDGEHGLDEGLKQVFPASESCDISGYQDNAERRQIYLQKLQLCTELAQQLLGEMEAYGMALAEETGKPCTDAESLLEAARSFTDAYTGSIEVWMDSSLAK